MSKQVQKRRGTSLEHANFTGALAEITVDTDTNEIVLGDGVTQGGRRVGISRVTTSDLVNSAVKYPQDDVIKTCGFTTSGDGGAGKWKQNGVTGQAPSQTPAQLGDALLNDASGNQWQLLESHNIDFRSLGAIAQDSPDGAVTNDDVFNAAQTRLQSNQGTLKVFGGVFPIDSLTISGRYNLHFQPNSGFFGVSSTAKDQVVLMRDYRSSKITGEMLVMSDGNNATPSYQQNYGCALRFTSSNTSSPTQFLFFDGINIKYIKAGIVSGNLLGDSAQQSFPQSEIFIKNYKVRGVQQCFYGNAINGYITFSGCVFSAVQFESSSWWDDNNKFNIRNDAGDVASVGDEFQISTSGGWNIYGKGITIDSPIWEQGTLNYVTGNVSISNTTNGFLGNANITAFEVDPLAEGRLHLNNTNIRRPNGVADFSSSLLIDCGSNYDYNIDVTDSVYTDWKFDLDDASAQFISGGNVSFNNLRIDNSNSSEPSYLLNTGANIFNSADPTGASMSNSQDLSTKSGWSSSSANGAFYGSTSDTPNDSSACIKLDSGAGTLVVVTPTGGSGEAFLVQPSRDYLVEFNLKRNSATPRFTLQVIFYDWTGTQIGSAIDAYNAVDSRLVSDGYDNWKKARAAVRSPDGAKTARVALIVSSGGSVSLNNIKVM